MPACRPRRAFSTTFLWPTAAGGIACQYPGTQPLIAYNAFWQNRPQDVVDCPLGPGNLFVDPRFVDAAGGDFRLRPDSPLRDAGHPEETDPDGTRGPTSACRLRRRRRAGACRAAAKGPAPCCARCWPFRGCRG
ncbi:MAG: hypothetical protein KatS3mg131_0363 [Candidatus Tectimicrobiota bacterium]|nr:MAG: hypothetical protein KatS3mg131_0363 [Candidatus Tectomicrobia bacterium]